MNLADIIDEIGIYEISIHINKYISDNELINNVSKYIPISNNLYTMNSVEDVVLKILSLRKKNIMFLSNEIAILEGLMKYKDYFDNIIVVLSNSLNNEQRLNIIRNSPNNKYIKYINELEFPSLMKPKNSAIISFGYNDGNKCLINRKNYRTLEIYKEFLGEKIFLSLLNEKLVERPKNWISINGENYFTKIV